MAKRYYLQSAVPGNPGKFTIDGDLTDVFKGYDSLTGLPATSFEVEATSGFNGTYTVLGSIYNGGTNRTEITISAALATGTINGGFITNTSVYRLTTVEEDNIVIVDYKERDTTTDLEFIGRNSAGWGETIQQNLFYLLNNFAANTEPSSPVIGQIWFDKNVNLLKIFNGSWQVINQAQSDPSQIGSYVHYQDTQSTTWNVYHNLNSYNIVYSVLVDLGEGGFKTILPADVTFVSSSEIELTFSVPRSGRVSIIRAADNGLSVVPS